MLSALAWIPKGAAARLPKRLEMTQEEFTAISNDIGAEVMEARMAFEAASLKDSSRSDDAQEDVSDSDDDAEGVVNDDDMKDNDKNDDMKDNDMKMKEDDEKVVEKPGLEKYDLDNYDETESGGKAGIPVFGRTVGLTYHDSNDQDPYIVVNDQLDEDEELQEMEIQPSDSLVIACRTTEEMSHLDVYVYEEEENNLYVHHDILLPTSPLCVEWLGNVAGSSGNFAAIGTFDPQIEIWDMDLLDAVYPKAILGSKTAKQRKKPSKKKAAAGGFGHTGPVSALSSNRLTQGLLLSGSIDTTVKLWDLNANDLTRATRTFTHHTDKVCAVAWNPSQPAVFLSGGFDGVYALDSRSPANYASWTRSTGHIQSDVECVAWDPHAPERYIVSTEAGLVQAFDARMGAAGALYTLHAHDEAVCGLALSPVHPGLLVTGGADRTVKVWDTRDASGVACLATRDLGVGRVFSLAVQGDGACVSVGGSKGKLVVWNLAGNSSVSRAFGIKGASGAKELSEAVEDGEHESSSDDEEEEPLAERVEE